MFSTAKYIMKGKCYVFDDYQEIKRVPFLSLECKKIGTVDTSST